MKPLTAALCLLVACGSVAAAPNQTGLVAHYTFDEGVGDILRDQSGNGNHGKIRGAKWVQSGPGYALKFDGVDDYVDCGKDQSLDTTDAISVEAWVRINARPTVPSEWNLVGKVQTSYALTYYMDGRSWWYAGSGNKPCTAPVGIGQWHHISGTFDGKRSTLYVDGKMICTMPAKHRTITSRKDLSLVIGSRAFPGMIDEVKVYSRALSTAEVAKSCESGKATKLAPHSRVGKGQVLKGTGFTLKVGGRGGMELEIGKDSYSFESAFSYPGDEIGWNSLSERPNGGPTWRPLITKPEPNVIVMSGKTKHYSLNRKLRMAGGRIEVEDALTALSNEPVGVIVENHIITPKVFQKCLLKGMPSLQREDWESGSNPTIFVAQNQSRVGVAAEDNISRLRFEASSALNRATFALRHLALTPGKAHRLEWAIYPLDKDADYYTMINRIREDWATNFTIEGPFEFGSIFRNQHAAAPDVLKSQLARKPIRVFALTPFLEYPSENRLARAEFKKTALETIDALKKASPGIKCLGSIEAGLVAVRPEKIRGGDKLSQYLRDYKGTVYAPVPTEISRILYEANLPWEDSFARSPDGRVQMEIYKHGGRTQTALMVTPARGNYQYEFLMDQVRFLIDDVGMDGIYFDTFGGGRDYSRWDGFSVDIDPRTGKIIKRYYDYTLDAARARVDVCNYILAKGKIVVANGGNAGVKASQSLPIFRVIENDPQPYQSGRKPPLNHRMCRLHLCSPIALIMSWGSAESIYKAVITYLRHGVVPYFYNSNFPAAGKGSGEYGPFKHMYPLTPVALHEGWVEAKERIISCVSGDYLWKGAAKPNVYIFDRVGKMKQHRFGAEKTAKGWNIRADLKNWEEIAIIETSAQARETNNE